MGELSEPAIGPRDGVAYALETTSSRLSSWAPRAGTPAAFLGKRPMSLCSNQASKWQLHEVTLPNRFPSKPKLSVAQLPWGISANWRWTRCRVGTNKLRDRLISISIINPVVGQSSPTGPDSKSRSTMAWCFGAKVGHDGGTSRPLVTPPPFPASAASIASSTLMATSPSWTASPSSFASISTSHAAIDIENRDTIRRRSNGSRFRLAGW